MISITQCANIFAVEPSTWVVSVADPPPPADYHVWLPAEDSVSTLPWPFVMGAAHQPSLGQAGSLHPLNNCSSSHLECHVFAFKLHVRLYCCDSCSLNFGCVMLHVVLRNHAALVHYGEPKVLSELLCHGELD